MVSLVHKKMRVHFAGLFTGASPEAKTHLDGGLHLSSLQEGSSRGKGGAPQRSLGLPAQKVTQGERGPPL